MSTGLPSYGCQEYWEQRYSREAVDSTDPLPFHSWYFNYEEMRSLLLPLILGTEKADAILESFAQDEEDAESSSSTQQSDEVPANSSPHQENDNKSSPSKTDAADGKATQQTEKQDAKPSERPTVEGKTAAAGVQADAAETHNIDENDDDEEEEEDGYDDEEEEEEVVENTDDNSNDEEVEQSEEEQDSEQDFEEASRDGDDTEEMEMIREPLSTQGPVSILEVGCGDVPLGTGLVMDLSSDHVGRMVCIDYSASVIQQMEDKFGKNSEPENKKIKTKQEPSNNQQTLEFQVADARNLPYPDDSFHMVLDKGTLDAMLSDRQEGKSNCRQMIQECARVLKTGGILLLVSHLNAFVPSGIEWLKDVVFVGLRSAEASSWSIEVHGNDGGDSPPGPAVYVIHKKPKDIKPSKIPIQFFSY